MKKVLVLVLVLFIMTASDSIAGMPFTFSPGTSIKSSEVNADLQYVNYGNIVVKANGVEIGTLIGSSPSGHVEVLNSNGFLMHIQGYTGTLLETYTLYSSSDCTGTPYAYATGSSSDSFMFLGSVFQNPSGNLFYIDKTATAINMTISSYISSNNTCTPFTHTRDFYPATPNDPAVTGVSSAMFATPITIERR